MSLGRADIETMLDDVYELGAAAIYTPANGGPAADVRAIVRMKDVDGTGDFGLPVQQQARVIAMLKAEAGDRPELGGTIEVLPGGMALAGVYTILEDATSDDRYQLEWVCRVGEPA